MLFSVNQASHLYVVREVVSGSTMPSVAGQIRVDNTKNGELYFTYFGEGGLIRSDLIPMASMELTPKIASSMDTKYRTATVKLNTLEVGTAPVSGQDYIIRIKYSIGSIDNQYLKYGIVHAHKGMSTAEALYKAMEESLKKNFAREADPVFTFSSSADGLVITEVEPKWVLGTYPQRPVDFEVSVDTITYEGTESPWGIVTYGVSSEGYSNSKKIADLEWFCMGERGDQYKNYGWPNVIPTKYMVDANSSNGYDTVNIHYYYSGSNESVQKSEKDIILVSEGSAGTSAGEVMTTLLGNIQSIIDELTSTSEI